MQLSTDERRALAVIAALLVLAAGARWIDRPRPLLEDVAALDLDSLEQASRAALPAPRTAVTAAAPVDPNTASAAELDRLPGVGPALAARIIAERDRAPFASVSDMRRVAGIGPALAQRLTPLLALPADAAPGERSSAPRPEDGPPEWNSAPPARAGPVDLNRATAAELERLSGVGPVLAARLIARRDSIGRFDSWDDVDAVTGVGPALLTRLRQHAVLRQTP